MKKKIISVLAMLLCLAMLLASCASTEEVEDPTFNSIVNENWKGLEEGKISVLSSQGKSIAVNGGWIACANETYLVTEEYIWGETDTIHKTYVYEIATESLILTLVDEETEPTRYENEEFDRSRVTEYYVDLIDENNFAVLNVAYDLVSYDGEVPDEYENGSYQFGSECFGVYGVPGIRLKDRMSSYYSIDINMDHSIDIYQGANATSAATFKWEIVEDWTNEDYNDDNFDENYEDIVLNCYTEDEEDIDNIGYDLIVKGTKVYKLDDDGEETLVKDFGASAIPSYIYHKTEEYYITRNNGSYTYYDEALNQQFVYTVPSYRNASSVYILNNGNLLVQHAKGLEADAKKYDFRENTQYGETRYDLVTLVINPKTGEETEIDFNFYIKDVDTAYSAKTEEMCWADGVENIVYATQIGEDKLIRTDYAAIDWISMTNDGEVKGSVKFDDSLASAPKAYSGNYLCATNLSGDTVIFTADGKIVNTINSKYSLSIIDSKYIVDLKEGYNEQGYFESEEVCLYDIAGNKLYDFDEKNAEICWADDTYDAFVTKYYQKGVVTYDVVFNGKVVDTFSVAGDEYVSIESWGYIRYVKTGVDENNEDTWEYRLYNFEGEQLLKSEKYMSVVFENEDKIIVYTTIHNEETFKDEITVYSFNFIKE